MEEIVQTLGNPRMIAALEANLEEEMMCFGRGLAGGEIYNDGEVEGFFTGRAYLNGILRTHLRNRDAESIEACIKAVLRHFRGKQVNKIGWSLGKDSRPEDMGGYLEEHGFIRLGEENIGMALASENLLAEETSVKGLEIREIEDLEGLKILRHMEMEGFNSSEEMAQNYYEMYAGVGFGRGTAWRHFSGWWQGEAAASTSLLFYAGVAGIYGVTTLPGARRHGIGRAMVLHAIEQARHAGYKIVILSPTDMSAGIYRRLGFREYTRIRHYTYSW